MSRTSFRVLRRLRAILGASWAVAHTSYTMSPERLLGKSKSMFPEDSPGTSSRMWTRSLSEASWGLLGSLSGASWMHFWGLWGPLGSLLCRLKGVLGASGGFSEASRGFAGGVGVFGPLLRLSWRRLGPSWEGSRAVLGPSCAVLGRSWGPPGPSWGGIESLLGRHGAVLGASWAVLGRSWGRLGPSWSVGSSKTREGQKHRKNQ